MSFARRAVEKAIISISARVGTQVGQKVLWTRAVTAPRQESGGTKDAGVSVISSRVSTYLISNRTGAYFYYGTLINI